MPVVGVVEPGARAAAHTTLNRRVGVIATKGTVDSNFTSVTLRPTTPPMSAFRSG